MELCERDDVRYEGPAELTPVLVKGAQRVPSHSVGDGVGLCDPEVGCEWPAPELDLPSLQS